LAVTQKTAGFFLPVTQLTESKGTKQSFNEKKLIPGLGWRTVRCESAGDWWNNGRFIAADATKPQTSTVRTAPAGPRHPHSQLSRWIRQRGANLPVQYR